MTNGIDRLDALTVQQLGDLLGDIPRPVLRDRFRLGGAAVPKQVRHDQTVALLGEIRDLVTPIVRRRRIAVQEKQIRLAVVGAPVHVSVDRSVVELGSRVPPAELGTNDIGLEIESIV